MKYPSTHTHTPNTHRHPHTEHILTHSHTDIHTHNTYSLTHSHTDIHTHNTYSLTYSHTDIQTHNTYSLTHMQAHTDMHIYTQLSSGIMHWNAFVVNIVIHQLKLCGRILPPCGVVWFVQAWSVLTDIEKQTDKTILKKRTGS